MRESVLEKLNLDITPKRQQIGKTNHMVEVSVLERWLLLSRKAAFSLLRALHIPLIHTSNKSFFNLSSLDRALYYLSRINGPGFACPGSVFKEKGIRKGPGAPRIALTDDDMQVIESAEFMAEWLALESNTASAQRLLISTLKGKK
jgi:hypothetical protein